ncbi:MULTISPECIES: hypothetical protein [unclassified Streptomyces]|uniref:hypothetical protein n=1 Tax=unclassified Streptomyces TaxID=2593676 RepID=UPI00226D6745|nr:MULTISPECIES: hypothetical protein [unclassified Streptomyces]MCY0924596.1 hypothetical protein [Streptomyces sp. H27-G5]MCY0963024.1 hypothetical protein [Streptomyces sp. H27-H5]
MTIMRADEQYDERGLEGGEAAAGRLARVLSPEAIEAEPVNVIKAGEVFYRCAGIV